jgi:hypothetical protein
MFGELRKTITIRGQIASMPKSVTWIPKYELELPQALHHNIS